MSDTKAYLAGKEIALVEPKVENPYLQEEVLDWVKSYLESLQNVTCGTPNHQISLSDFQNLLSPAISMVELALKAGIKSAALFVFMVPLANALMNAGGVA